MPNCGCAAASQRRYETVRDGIAWGRDNVLRDCAEIARNETKWVFLLRCGSCGMIWAEACWSSGQMEVYYIFPVPRGQDPMEWLRERADELPWDASGPQGEVPARPPAS
jgi:hypothetical protein